tara:strand:- start:1722 stop:2765 length:1044 start_codon:yes stop_codon:yes gene_type:complete
MIKYLKSLLRLELIEPLKTIKLPEFLNNIKPFKKYSFGKKNKNIKFYVIKRNYNFNGLFSNLIFVIDHIKYAKEKKMIPIIDMENFVTVYNENNKINKSLNAWTYYFKQVSQYNLEEVYKSKNVYFSNDRRIYKKEINEDKSLLKIYKKYIHINYDHMKYFKKLKKKIFYNKGKILGIHIRGGIEKVVRGHSFPPRPEDILKESIKIFKKRRCNKIFLVTEDLDYFDIFKKYYKNKLITLNTPRSKAKMFGNHNAHFTLYSRKNHRYMLGKEALIDVLLLSCADVIFFTHSNVWRFSLAISKKKQIKYQMKTGYKSYNKYISRWQWYLKYLLPKVFGNINYKILSVK